MVLVLMYHQSNTTNDYYTLLWQNAVEQPPRFVGRWAGTFTINIFVVVWVFIIGFGFGGWASMLNFIHQIDTFGLFTKCYQCPSPKQFPIPPPPYAAAPQPAPANFTHHWVNQITKPYWLFFFFCNLSLGIFFIF